MTNVDPVVEVVEVLIRMMVEKPDEVRVSVLPESKHICVLQVVVASSDAGKIIGKQGRTARALRVILESISSSIEPRLRLDIQNPVEASVGLPLRR